MTAIYDQHNILPTVVRELMHPTRFVGKSEIRRPCPDFDPPQVRRW
jgi:hypothetical protein